MRQWVWISLWMLAAIAFADSANLIKDGDLSQIPDLKRFKGYSAHGNFAECTFPPGSTDMPGWTVVGDSVVAEKGVPTDINLEGVGGISQLVDTVPGRLYRLSFKYAEDFHGARNKQTLQVTMGDGHEVVRPPSWTQQNRDGVPTSLTFHAGSRQTLIEFKATCGGRFPGPIIHSISLTPYDPAAEALMGDARQAYSHFNTALARGDVATALQTVAPDYQSTALDGKTGSRDDLSSWLTDLANKRASRTWTVENAVPIGDHAVDVTVNQSMTYDEIDDSNVTHHVHVTRQVVDRWQVDGKIWTWKNTTEKAYSRQVDGK